jgi:5'-nucleotidase
MNRRHVWLAIAFVTLCVCAATAAVHKSVPLKIIAFNDFHGNLQSPGNFRANAQSADVPVGGAEYLAAYVNSLEAENPNHIVVAAGDLVGASPLVSGLFHDEPTIEAMNRLGLDISSVGNHEFDRGSAELLRKQHGGCSTQDQQTCEGAQVGTPVPFEGAKFEYLAANVVDTKTGKTIFPAYAIRTFGGVRIAFIGLTLQATPTMVVPSGVAGLKFTEEADTINNVVRELEKQKIRSFVVLIHQGGAQVAAGPVDINGCEGGLEASPIQAIVSHLDDAVGLVISGHTHAAYICQLANSSGRKIPVTSALSYGRVVTDIDVNIDAATQKFTSVTAKNILVDRTNPAITPNAEIKTLVDKYAAIAAPLANRKVGTITAEITNKINAAGESELGDVIADAQLDATRTSAGAQIAFMNRGGIRTSLPYSSKSAPDGIVTYGELFAIQPFGNSVVTMTLTGAQIKTLLEQQFKGCSLGFPPGKTANRFDNQILQVSGGFTYTWNPSGAACDKVEANSIRLNGTPIAAEQKYRVTVNSFLADGGDQMYEFTLGTERVTGGNDADALADYFTKHQQISPAEPNRIRVAAPGNP